MRQWQISVERRDHRVCYIKCSDDIDGDNQRGDYSSQSYKWAAETVDNFGLPVTLTGIEVTDSEALSAAHRAADRWAAKNASTERISVWETE